MKIKYANEFVQKLGMGDPTTFVYKFIYDENENDDTKIMQYFIIHRLGLCIKVDNYVAHMFDARSLSYNKEVPISIQTNKYFLT